MISIENNPSFVPSRFHPSNPFSSFRIVLEANLLLLYFQRELMSTEKLRVQWMLTYPTKRKRW